MSHSTTERPTKRNEVTFSRHVRVKTTQHLNDYTENEIQACWFNESERIQIRHDAIKTSKMRLDQQESSSKKLISFRGLEYQTSQGKHLRRTRRSEAYHAVIAEQDKQVSTGMRDDTKIASVYSKAALSSKVQAHLMGLADYREILTLSLCENIIVHKSQSDPTLKKSQSDPSMRTIVSKYRLVGNRGRLRYFLP